ncbi:MAG: flagellar hook basal-body protein [Sphingomonas sp.]|uniref:flagellar hook-basal body protein n=1 Tax=Sphingomonas sp. TaxID=28214 RepID=UPI0022763C6E|nr:flagellar hook basal-body protein [Sphingomonas sp.]MCX8475451.1 flagellar hook basal-body protein [Sphingomonas sp.]
MSGLIESAAAILSASERRLEIAAHNVANVSTPGYKRSVGFSRILASMQESNTVPDIAERRDFIQGKLISSGNPFDLAINGDGFFQVRAGEQLLYTRQGQFRRAENGTIVSAQGHVLQQAGGGDLVLEDAAVTILDDGAVLEDGRPVARIGLSVPAGGAALDAVGESHFAAGGAMEEVAEPSIRQGMLESSNVSMGDEMVTTMAAMRQAEGGARLVQVYDELMGRALTTLGGGR